MLDHVDVISAYVQAFALATILTLIWLAHRLRTAKGFSLWLASGVTGVLLGGIGAYAAMNAAGYKVVKIDKTATASTGGSTAPGTSAMTPAPGGGMGGMMGGGMGGGGMGGGGMGGGRGPNPKRDLSTLVRKLNLLTDDIAIKLSADQSAALIKGLSGVDAAEKFTDDEAKAMYEELMAVLSEEQKAKLELVGMPGGGRGGGGMGGGGGGMGGGPPDPNANPFRQENNLKALQSFRTRFAPDQPAASAEPAEPASTSAEK